MTVSSSNDILNLFGESMGASRVTTGSAVSDDFCHDECLTVNGVRPAAVVAPTETSQVCSVLREASRLGIPLTARGSGTGLSGGCVPEPGGIVVCFEQMNRILEIDEANHVAVVQPGVTLAQLDEATARHGLVYPVFPGENSASLGGNVATNAGGMRAVKYGVTRHHVLGVEAALVGGDVVRSGGKYVKSSSGYDLTQLLVGSEGTLALITEVTVKLQPRLSQHATLLAPFATLGEVTGAIAPVMASGVGPMILEYIDTLTMAAATAAAGLDLGIATQVSQSALAYLVVVLESNHPDRLDTDVEQLATLLTSLGAMDVYVLPATAAEQLITARERAFFVAKAHGANDIIDVVVPRSEISGFLADVSQLAEEHGSLVAGCGHAGDGNVHLSVFQTDQQRRHELLDRIFRAGIEAGGAVSGEHGLGRAKRAAFVSLEDPVKLGLLRRIKDAFDPLGILNPSLHF